MLNRQLPMNASYDVISGMKLCLQKDNKLET